MQVDEVKNQVFSINYAGPYPFAFFATGWGFRSY